MSIRPYFEKFKCNFRYQKCLDKGYHVFYVFSSAHAATKASMEANDLIERLNLPLVAIHFGDNQFFTLQSNQTEV